MCDPHDVRLCVHERLRLTDFVVSCGPRSARGAVLGCVYFASLLWGWTLCGPPYKACDGAVVSFRSAFALVVGWRGRRAGDGAASSGGSKGAGRGISHFIPNYDVFRSLCWPDWTDGARSAATLSGGPSVSRCLRGLLVSGRPSSSKPSSARRGPSLQAGSRRLQLPPHPGFVHFWSVSRVRLTGSAGEPGKDNGRILQASRLGWGPSGSFPRKEHFPTPSPGERHSRRGRVPVASVTRAGLR